MAKKELTIIGATGFLSTTITKHLVSLGVKVQVVVRDPENAKNALPDCVEIVQGDVSDAESLIRALDGTETLYIHLNTETTDMNLPFYTEREGVQNIVQAAKHNGVKHIMQIAGLESLHEEFFLNGTIETRKIREAGMKCIEDSDIPYTFFYCSFFADSFTRFVDNNVAYLFGILPHEAHFTSSFQLAGHIFEAIDNSQALNQRYPVQGSEAMTFADAAQRFFKVYDPKVSVQTLPLETIDQLGLPLAEAAFLKRIWEVCAGFEERFVSGETYENLGKPSASIEALAATLKENVLS
ncbi:SDR family oxidoreductase [Pelagicoccus mobilis]|uniref:NAD(P)H-binding protein n=1 Tax=Pelagicoccus mobilis TaxID=415221 RepID=A0A934RXM6_9BACT|nr:NAD(P)H-binding protein [Pelagicoccus mobilis]MBK1875769.1 NAD(P)H-binding protein [Pelagicoccus mobilis]